MKTKFEIECQKIADTLNLGDVLFFADECKEPPFEDDGSLHVIKRGMRACFDVGDGQRRDGKSQNEFTRAVLTALKMERFINDRTLVEENDEDDETCPHCGR
jgi:hypothetical protein